MAKVFKSFLDARQFLVAVLWIIVAASFSGTPRLQAQGILTRATPTPKVPGVRPQGTPVPQKNQTAGRVVRARLMDTTQRKASSPCPVQENFVGDITTNGPAEVKYTWVSFDGGTWPEGTLHFSGAGTQRVSEHVKLGAAGKNVHGWMQLKVLSPNGQLSNRVNYTIICPPAGGSGRVIRAQLKVSSNPARNVAARCPVQENLNGTISTNGPAEVTYTWISSDNATWPRGTLRFTGASTQAVHETWTLGGAGTNVNGWVRLRVLSPNQLTSNPAAFRFQCPAAAR